MHPYLPSSYFRGRNDIGRTAYERSFNICFIDEDKIDPNQHTGFLTRTVPTSYTFGFPTELTGKSVAVVGNGMVRGHGAAIDSHDEIIRISSMRNWMKSAEDDGVRTTLWVGLLSRVVQSPTPDPAFAALVQSGVPLWCLSPFHITCDAAIWLRSQPNFSSLIILPTAALLFDVYHRFLSAEEMEIIFSIPPARRQLNALSRYERLLTGTRLLLALEACGVHRIDLYGFDFFAGQEETVWFGHDVDVDRMIIQGVEKRLTERNGYLRRFS